MSSKVIIFKTAPIPAYLRKDNFDYAARQTTSDRKYSDYQATQKRGWKQMRGTKQVRECFAPLSVETFWSVICDFLCGE